MGNASKWAIESIPDSDSLYRWFNKIQLFNQVGIPLNSFKDNNGISTDWSKYSTPKETLNREIAKRLPNSSNLTVIKANVGQIRSIRELSIKHAPRNLNRAHTNIHGLSECPEHIQTDIRRKLANIFSVIPKEQLE